MTITTLRPSSTTSDGGWSVTPSGTPHGVTSDDNDSTYALWSGSGVGLVMGTPLDSPPVGERRHQVRLRLRGSHGDAWWSVILASGALVAGSSAQFDTTPETVIGSWGFGAPPDGPTTLSAYVTGQSAALRAIEVYVDVDSREAPSFTPQTINGAGSVDTTITDTATPVIRASAIDLDDLSARQYRYWVTRAGAIVWDTGIVSGGALDQVTSPLDNGSYVAHLQIWSTLGANTAYASEEETVDFTISVGDVPAPDNPNVSPVAGTPLYEISACAPDLSGFDGEQGYIEIQRVDCPTGGYLRLPGTTGGYASTDDPGHVFTDLQVTVFAQRDDGWHTAGDDTLAAWYDPTGDDRAWRLFLDQDGGGDPALNGRPILTWSPDGTHASSIDAAATQRAPIDPYGRVKLRVTLDTDNGAGGWTALFQTEIDGEWQQLGDLVTGTGTTSIHAATGVDYTVGSILIGGSPSDEFPGRIYSAEIREGAAGAILADPDFTGHMGGTSSFTDDRGNEWTIHAPAAITSDQRITTLTIAGPLATDECTSWVDWSLPRTGVGITCSHQPVPCCSYYRARTIVHEAGALQISDWSGVWNPGVPEGLIVMWPAAAADVPEGWTRTTALDGRYPKGIATSGTQPGAQGGAANHLHTAGAHDHTVNHSHTTTGNTSSAVGVSNSHDGVAGTMAIAATHTHTRPATGSTTVSSAGTIPDIGTVANDPARLEVVFIESDGNPLGVPDGAVSITDDGAITGWTDYADATDRFVKGAAPGADGGATAASALDDHTHPIADHTHAGTAHTHTSANTGSVTSNLSLFAGPTSNQWTFNHAHPITIGSATTAVLGSTDSGGDSGAADSLPPYTNVRIRQNTSGAPDLPVGLICAWRGSLGSIPDNWQLCDGTNGTPDLIGVYPRGATASIGAGGGSLDPHSHTSPSHTHPTSGHSHGVTIGTSTGTGANTSATVTVSVARADHTHTASDTDSATPTPGDSTSGTLANTTAEPLHEEVAFVQLMEEPTPPPDPATFCLTWSDDEHLVRSEGPDGPLWSVVLGKFTWDRDRPFTSATGVAGTRFVTSAAPGGRNLHLQAAVESEAELATLRAVLARPLVLVSPSDATEVWAAPVAESVRVVKIGRIRQLTADFIGTGPQPPPQLADVGD